MGLKRREGIFVKRPMVFEVWSKCFGVWNWSKTENPWFLTKGLGRKEYRWYYYIIFNLE